jgi:hypothetical protein
MEFRVLERASEISQVQNELVAAFRKNGAKPVRTNLGYKGETVEYRVLWIKDLGLWLATRKIPGSRYWNALGTKDPHNRSVPITCELNLPVQGIDRRIGGIAAADAQGRTILAHRGRIGGGRQGIGSKLFWDNYEGKRVTVWDGDRESDVAAVAELGSPRFLRQIRFFVHEVERIKALAARSQPDERTRSDGGYAGVTRFQVKALGDEFSGVRRYTVSRTVNAVCDHGLIVKKLRELLARQGYAVGKDRFRDLYVYHQGKVTSLFEVKPSTDRLSVYMAVGQLFLHSADLNPRPRLIFIAPAGMGGSLRATLRQIGIEVLGFEWEEGEPIFPGLESWKF